ncbi:MAG: hypothetical protein U0L91_02540 [Gemmiger sp.]|uniref:O-antigen ligase family protein n=1 Tax=Gemmiger sp. TaxID=2049027 RepID=UPI002E7856D0|nr:hypothetical protein [Gemmiger sp.]MEE0800139.1 hypothetical protein [Gemmiger sp.]
MDTALQSSRRTHLFRQVMPGDRVFCTAVVMLLILSEVFSSNIQTTLPTFSYVCRLALTVGTTALLIGKLLFFTDWDSRRQPVIAAVAVLYAAAAAWYGNDQWFFLAVLIGTAAKGVDLRRALRVYLAAAVAGLVVVQLLHYTTDLIPFSYYCRNWDYGYGHYNGYGARLAGVFFAWGWLRWPRLKLWDWAGLTALAVYTLLVPGSRGAGMTMVMLLVLFAAQKLLPAFFESRVWHGIVLALMPLATAGSLVAGYLFDPGNPGATPLLEKLNRLLSGRFEVWHHVFWRFPIWHVEEDGTTWYHGEMPATFSLFGGVATDGDEHHAIDNAFLALPMNKGLVGAVLIGAMFLFLLWRLCRRGRTGETLFLAAILLYFLMENKPFLFSADPFVFLLPAALLTPRGAPLPVVCPRPQSDEEVSYGKVSSE